MTFKKVNIYINRVTIVLIQCLVLVMNWYNNSAKRCQAPIIHGTALSLEAVVSTCVPCNFCLVYSACPFKFAS